MENYIEELKRKMDEIEEKEAENVGDEVAVRAELKEFVDVKSAIFWRKRNNQQEIDVKRDSELMLTKQLLDVFEKRCKLLYEIRDLRAEIDTELAAYQSNEEDVYNSLQKENSDILADDWYLHVDQLDSDICEIVEEEYKELHELPAVFDPFADATNIDVLKEKVKNADAKIEKVAEKHMKKLSQIAKAYENTADENLKIERDKVYAKAEFNATSKMESAYREAIAKRDELIAELLNQN
ncbi:hypothetical protein [Enterococcus sp. DIV0187]|uniref:hypothetical protein n=1 Tax=Enterococcus sp. DIV0187 TaxID=2774644 RepID=UPI003F205979